MAWVTFAFKVVPQRFQVEEKLDLAFPGRGSVSSWAGSQSELQA
jgi:hypothetical protein